MVSGSHEPWTFQRRSCYQAESGIRKQAIRLSGSARGIGKGHDLCCPTLSILGLVGIAYASHQASTFFWLSARQRR